MIKKTLYPKTKRVGSSTNYVTEKLDGSNLGLFKLNGKLIVAQRNNVFIYPEIDKGKAYKGLIGWLDTHADSLLGSLHEGSGVFGEWIGMGRISYSNRLDLRFYIFAKARINEELEITKLKYNLDSIKYAFIDESIPEYVGLVPLIYTGNQLSLDKLNSLYDEYCNCTDGLVEGFIVNQDDEITKYVRCKGNKLQPHWTGADNE